MCLLVRALTPPGDATLLTSSNPNHHPKAPRPLQTPSQWGFGLRHMPFIYFFGGGGRGHKHSVQDKHGQPTQAPPLLRLRLGLRPCASVSSSVKWEKHNTSRGFHKRHIRYLQLIFLNAIDATADLISTQILFRDVK